MPGKHASKSPSSSHRWGGRDACTASIGAQVGKPDNAHDVTRRGSTGHTIVDECLSAHARGQDYDTGAYLGREMVFWKPERPAPGTYKGMDWREDYEGGASYPGFDIDCEHVVKVDEQLIGYCDTHIAFVLNRLEVTGGELFVEDRVPIDHITGEEDAHGSTDTAIVYGRTCEIIDLKLGGREVRAYDVVVPAHEDLITGEAIPEQVEPNSQCAMYCSGTMRKLEAFYDFDDVVIVISQPSIGRVSQWSGTVADLNKVIDRLRVRSAECDNDPVFNASSDNCTYCKASGDCQPQTDVVLAAFNGTKPMLLGQRYALVPLMRQWIEDTERLTHAELHAGNTVMRDDGLTYKLVDGRNGARTWVDEAKAERLMEAMRLKTELMYKPRKLISPTDAEALSKSKRPKKGQEPVPPVLGKTQWNRLLKNVTQERCAPVIALQTDPRPARASATDGFEDVVDDSDFPNADLF